MNMKKTIILLSAVISMTAFAQHNGGGRPGKGGGQHMQPPMGMNQGNGQQRPPHREDEQSRPPHMNGQGMANGQNMPPPPQMGMNQGNGQQRPPHREGEQPRPPMGMNQGNGQQRPPHMNGREEVKLPPAPGMMGMSYGQTPRGTEGGARR